MPRKDRSEAVDYLKRMLESCGLEGKDIGEWLTLFEYSDNITARQIRTIARLLIRVRSLVANRTEERVKRETTNSLVADMVAHLTSQIKEFASGRYLPAPLSEIPTSGPDPDTDQTVIQMPKPEYDDTFDEDPTADLPEMTEEILAKMFANLREHGIEA